MLSPESTEKFSVDSSNRGIFTNILIFEASENDYVGVLAFHYLHA